MARQLYRLRSSERGNQGNLKWLTLYQQVTYWISDEEIQILEKNATNGDKNSAFKLYQYHMFVSLDQDSEFKWLEIAAKNGHPIAQFNLADLFFTQGNKEKAIFWANKAYRNGAKLPEELKILININ